MDAATVIRWPGMSDVESGLLPLFEYWQARAPDGVAAPVGRIDPLRLPAAMLPWLFLVERTVGADDYRFRLIGTGICDFLGRDMTGRRVSEIPYPAPVREFIEHAYPVVMDEAIPVAFSHDTRWLDGAMIETRGLLLPASTNGSAVDRILGGLISAGLREPRESLLRRWILSRGDGGRGGGGLGTLP